MKKFPYILNGDWFLLPMAYSGSGKEDDKDDQDLSYESETPEMITCVKLGWFRRWLANNGWKTIKGFLSMSISEDVAELDHEAEMDDALAFCYVPALRRFLYPAHVTGDAMEALVFFREKYLPQDFIVDRLSWLPNVTLSTDKVAIYTNGENNGSLEPVMELLKALGVKNMEYRTCKNPKSPCFGRTGICFSEQSVFCQMAQSLSEIPEGYKSHGTNAVFSDRDALLCETEDMANFVADVLDVQDGVAHTTGYYDPEEDEKSGETDRLTGFWYIEC